ncbi:MAG TPA: T6SS immunity protein Tdi1 domain-containing protein [Allosphingosinicella sp.]|jgi:hypothetical protein
MAAKKEPERSVAAFRKACGPAQPYRPFKPADAKRLGERLPAALRLLAEMDGWASYAEQTFWLCDPDDWSGIADDWMEDAPGAEVVMRTGFGDLLVWDGAFFWLVMPHQSSRMRLTDNAEWLLRSSLLNPESYFQKDLPGMMERARREAGSLEADTLYTYVPALALGGDDKSSKIETEKAREALSILAQLAPVAKLGL